MSASAGSPGGSLVMVGLSHQTAPLDVREQLTFDLAGWYAGSGVSVPVVLLSTCNRVELYAWAERNPARLVKALRCGLSRVSGVPAADLAPFLVSTSGSEAILHLVRVAGGLDSLVVGEEQIRGQVRAAYRAARAYGPLPGVLDGIFHRTLQAARCMAASTPFGRRPSIASAAVSATAHLPEVAPTGLQGQLAIVLGAGSMARAAGQALITRGARLVLLNRTPEHAADLASRLGAGTVVGNLADLPRYLSDALVVVGATASRQPVLDEATARAAMTGRPDRPLVILDIALPRDVEPGVRSVPGARLLDLDDLEALCPVDIGERQAEVGRAEGVAHAEAARIEHWLRVRALSPAIAELREHGDRVRAEALRRSASRLRDLTPEQQATVEAMARSIVNKLLHGPTIALREAAEPSPRPRRSASSVLSVVGTRSRSRPR